MWVFLNCVFDKNIYTVPLTDYLYFEAQHPSLGQAPLAELPAVQYLSAVQSNLSPTCFLHLVTLQPADIKHILNKQDSADNNPCAITFFKHIQQILLECNIKTYTYCMDTYQTVLNWSVRYSSRRVYIKPCKIEHTT